nr:MMPL family transporter [Luteimonas weifangensis]
MTPARDHATDSRRRLALALLWLASLVVLGWMLGQRLQLSGDLRKFMPTATTPAQALLLDELGEGPGARLLLLALSGDDAPTLARQSQALRQRLAGNALFTLVANGGEPGLDAIPAQLRPYRYLLAPARQRLDDPDFLRAQLHERLQDLGSPAAGWVEPLLAADPTLETLALAEAWQPANAPQRRHGVWFDRAGTQALLVAATVAPGFDPGGQQAAVDAIRAAFAAGRGHSTAQLALTGPGAFSVEIGNRTAREAGWIGSVDTLGLVLLLWFAYRSWKAPLLGVLPLASAGLAGLGAVALLFDGVHGITVAFGFTLIGVVQDYPIHLFSHQHAGLSPRASARALWPTLATGVVSTCIAYVTFLVSGVAGLQQLAVFTIAGLVTAALATRFLLPALIDPAPRDAADSPWLARSWARIERLPRPRAALALLAAVALAVIALAPGAFWQNDLAKLTPVPAAALARDAQLRSELGAPDVRYVIALPGRDVEATLQAAERLQPALERLRATHAIAGYDSPARYLPSVATQRARQAALPDTSALQAALAAALATTPFRDDAFAAFVADVAAARRAPPLTPRDLDGSALAARVGGLLLQRSDHATALVALSGLRDPAAVAQAAQAQGAQLLDLKQASESLVVAYRQRVLLALALAALLLAATVWLALRASVVAGLRASRTAAGAFAAPGAAVEAVPRPRAPDAPVPAAGPDAQTTHSVARTTTRRTLRVLAPMALTTLLILAVLRGCGVELTLFHLVALILAAGLGLDYALFFEHAGDERAAQLRTLHAVIVCSLTTLLVFALLALSSIPVLRAIGSTVALGVAGNFVLALLIARGGSGAAESAAAAAADARA